MNNEKLASRYERIFIQLKELIPKTSDTIARMATVAALLHFKMDQNFWTGFYILRSDVLVVGPYQGPVACQELAGPEGVCWAGVLEKRTILVPDVHKFPGHIACDSRSNSEVVVPLIDQDKNVWAVLDIDSTKLNAFSDTDAQWLEKIVSLI